MCSFVLVYVQATGFENNLTDKQERIHMPEFVILYIIKLQTCGFIKINIDSL